MKNFFIKGILCLGFTIFMGCGKKTKKETKKQESTIEIVESKPKDLFSELQESFENGVEVNKVLGGWFTITKVSVIPDPDSNDSIYVSFLLDSEITDEDLKDYELQLNMFAYAADIELLRDVTKEKKRDYDSWYFKPKVKTKDGVTFLYKKITTPLSEFRQIYIHLYDVNKKKIEPESIIVKDLLINLQNTNV